MKTIYEVGDMVRVKAVDDMSVAYTNEVGGTSEFPVGTVKDCQIIKAWRDHEIGRRYIGVSDNGQRIYFGHFGVEIQPLDDPLAEIRDILFLDIIDDADAYNPEKILDYRDAIDAVVRIVVKHFGDPSTYNEKFL